MKKVLKGILSSKKLTKVVLIFVTVCFGSIATLAGASLIGISTPLSEGSLVELVGIMISGAGVTAIPLITLIKGDYKAFLP